MTERIGALPPEGLGIAGAILIGDTDRGAPTRRDLWLTFTVEGIRVHSSEGTESSLLAWSGMDSARCVEQVLLPDGRGSTVLELNSEGQSVRFLLPHDQLTPRQRDYLEAAVPVWLTAYGRGTVPASPAPQGQGAVDEVAAGPAATETPVTAVPGVDAASLSSPPPPPPIPPPPPPLGVSPPPPPAPEVVPPANAGTGQPAPLGTPQATVIDHGWVPAGPEAPEFIPLPPPPRSANGSTVDPGTRNGPAGDDVPEPVLHPPTPPLGTVPVVTGFGAAAGSAFFHEREDDAPAGQESAEPEASQRQWRTNYGRRATDRPPEDEAQILSVEEAGDPSEDEAEGEDEAEVEEQGAHHRRRLLPVVVTVLIAAGIGGYFLYRGVLHPNVVPAATPADVARAASINLRLTDLPSGFSENAPVPPGPPAAPAARRVAALGTLASCLGQPRSSVQGWFGTRSFPEQITFVRSPTFANPTVPTVEMYSTTALVVASSATSSSLEAALGSPKFPACFGQFQVASLSVPATGQVQAIQLGAPPGVKAYGYQTMFTLADGTTSIIGDAFIVGSGVVTLLQASTEGPSIPPGYFNPAFQAVAGRVASASV